MSDEIHAEQGTFVGIDGPDVCSACTRGQHSGCNSPGCACRLDVVARAKAATAALARGDEPVDEEPQTVIVSQKIVGLTPYDAKTYPELLRRQMDMAVEALASRVSEQGLHGVGGPMIAIYVEQLAEER